MDGLDAGAVLEQIARLVTGGAMLPPAKVVELVSPNAHHERLHVLAGVWDAPSRLWLRPGLEPIESPGHAERTMILGGRFLMETYEAQVMGQRFSGIGFNGYDNFEQCYTAVWMDDISTAMMITRGTCDESGLVLEFHGEHKDALSGVAQPSRSTIEIESDDHYVLRTWITQPDGAERPLLDIDYRRK